MLSVVCFWWCYNYCFCNSYFVVGLFFVVFGRFCFCVVVMFSENTCSAVFSEPQKGIVVVINLPVSCCYYIFNCSCVCLSFAMGCATTRC